MRKHKINKVISLLKVKVEITASGVDGDKDLFTEVPSLARSTSPFGEGVEHNAHTKPTRATLFLLTLSPMQDVVIPLWDT